MTKKMTKEEAEKAGYHHYEWCSVIPCAFVNDSGEFIEVIREQEQQKRIEKRLEKK